MDGAKPYGTDELKALVFTVNGWRRIDGGRLLATTRALEAARAELSVMPGRIKQLLDEAGAGWAVAEKLRAERDAARATVAELVAALEGLVGSWEAREDGRQGWSALCDDAEEQARAAWAKAKG